MSTGLRASEAAKFAQNFFSRQNGFILALAQYANIVGVFGVSVLYRLDHVLPALDLLQHFTPRAIWCVCRCSDAGIFGDQAEKATVVLADSDGQELSLRYPVAPGAERVHINSTVADPVS